MFSISETDRRAGRPAFENSGKNLDLIGFLRCVVWRDGPAGGGRDQPEYRLLELHPGGQPSTTQPSATPWLSPNVVTTKFLPILLPDTL